MISLINDNMSLIPTYLDPRIVDSLRLIVRYGSFTKRFVSYEEMDKWKVKAIKLEGGAIFYYDLEWKQK